MTQKAECGIVDFRLKDGKDSILPMFIGDYETAALLNFITKKEMVDLHPFHKQHLLSSRGQWHMN